MPFTAVCPHCRAAKFRARRKKIGSAFACTRCKEEFQLQPATKGELRALKAARIAHTAPESAAETTPTPAAAPAEAVPTPPPVAHTDYPLRFALVALGMFGLAVVAGQFPYGRFAAAPLAGLGAILAALTLFGLEKQRRVAWAGVALNGLAFVGIFAFPDWIGQGSWVPTGGPENGPKQVLAFGRDGTLPRVAAEWVNSHESVWEHGDVRVAVDGLLLLPAEKKAKNRFLQIRLKLTNVGVARAVQFTGWPPAPPPDDVKLSTQAGIFLDQRADTEKPAKVAVLPGKTAETTLTFAANPGPPSDLRLELPAKAFGGTEPVKFQIPRAQVPTR